MEGKLADVVPPCRDYGSEEPKSDMHRAAPHSPEGRGILRRSYIVTISGPRGALWGLRLRLPNSNAARPGIAVRSSH